MKVNKVEDIRQEFRRKLAAKEFVNGTIEIVGACFEADEPNIFGTSNDEWFNRELEWYLSKSLNVKDIPPPIPAIWKAVATPEGRINSNYGWAILSAENGHQYWNVVEKLRKDPNSRQGQMIYTRPSMHEDWNREGMKDFMCCSNTVHLIRAGKLETCVNFRSCDSIFGYRGDRFWMNYVHQKLAAELQIEPGKIIWSASSLHIYERHYHLVL